VKNAQPPVAVAVLTSLPVRSVALESTNEVSTSTSRANPVLSKSATPENQDSPVLSKQAATATLPSNTIRPDSPQQTPSISKPELVLASLKQGAVRKPAPTASNAQALTAPALMTGLTEMDMDFLQPFPTQPNSPDVFATTPTTLDANNTASENAPLDWEDQMYAGIREVLQSPVTYQVLTGASSVAFLVKTLLPGWLPSFQMPGSLPNPAPVRLPTSPASMVNGRTTLGRWLGRA